ncbi:MAG: oligosaccharide flippase family protein [Candidatus Kapaibacterium sp.]
MMEKRKYLASIVSAVSKLLSAEGISLLLAMAFNIILGREIKEEAFGAYSLALIVAILMKTISEAGLEISIPRDINRPGADMKQSLFRGQEVKNTVWLMLILPFIPLMYFTTGIWSSLIMLLWVIPMNISFTYKAILRGKNRMGAIARYETVFNFIQYGAGITLVFLFPEIWIIFILFMTAELLKSLALYNYVRKYYSINVKYTALYKVNFGILKEKSFIKEHWSLLSINLFSLLHYRMPLFAAGWFGTAAAAGLFSAALRFISLLRVLPGIVLNVMIPVFSVRRSSGERGYRGMVFGISAAVGIAISLALWMAAEPLMKHTFGFMKAVPVLKVLAWVYFPIMLNNTMEAWLLAEDRESEVNTGLFIALLVIFGASAWFIILYGSIGAAYAALAGNYFITFYYVILIFKKTKS